MEKEPGEKLLDQHYQSQLRRYKRTHRRNACPSDQIVIAKWLRVFSTVPKEQKLARNSLMILMYGHLKEFGYLRDPFVDIANLDKDLNVILDSYAYLTVTNENLRRHTKNNVEPSLESVIRYALRHPVNNELQPQDARPRSKDYSRGRKWSKTRTLQPIEELAEISEMEPTSNRDIEKHSKDNTYNSHRCYKSDPDLKEQRLKQLAAQEEKLKSVRDRIENYELAMENELQQQQCQSSGNYESDEKIPTTSEITNYEENPQSGGDVANEATVGISTTTSGHTESSNSLESRPQAVRSLKVCFDKMAEMITRSQTSLQDQHPKHPKPPEMSDAAESKPEAEIETQNQRKTQIQTQTTTTRAKERVTSIPLQIVMHQEWNSHQTEGLNRLRKRNRELRKSCLKYYNLDGSLKQQQRSSHCDEMKGKQRTQGFLIGAHRAMKRLQRWHGLPQRLGFFATCFGLTGLGLGQWRWRAIDRGLERATHKWYCHTLQHSQEHAWRSYRRIMLNQSLPKAAEALSLLNQVLNGRKELILERMSHLQQLKQLCAQECAGRVNGVQLQQMLTHLEDKYLQLAKDLHSLACQQQQQH
ncbi:uncharacterized protein Dwil_GK17183 [Drosophila willistoni]|uniref:DUF4485 domain-containing protein n=2 Tax=Drosophila willistoni TaxID=7260 RepID=B4MKQ9_DROWI|nr:uncharacterized protein Dwil_GK17183 [Drosophila willistoni]